MKKNEKNLMFVIVTLVMSCFLFMGLFLEDSLVAMDDGGTSLGKAELIAKVVKDGTSLGKTKN